MSLGRKILLPDNLNSAAWVDLTNAIDAVFKSTIDDPAKGLAQIRHVYRIPESTEDKINLGNILSVTDLQQFDRKTIGQSCSMLGFAPSDISFLTDEMYDRIHKSISNYWYSVGKSGDGNAADFLSYILDSSISITKTWTEDYKVFYPQGDPRIGTPITLGGTWFPTTHVEVEYNIDDVKTMTLNGFLNLLYSVCSYNLVIGRIKQMIDLIVVNYNEENIDSLSFPKNFNGSATWCLGLSYTDELYIPQLGL